VEAIRDGLRDLGYSEGRDIDFEVRWAEGRLDRLTDLTAELVGLKVDVIITTSTPAALAARNATTTIPIVFTLVGDPVGSGLVPSLARPGGNATGLSLLATELSAKRLEILHEIVPNMSRVAMLWNDTNSGMVLRAREAQIRPSPASDHDGLAVTSFDRPGRRKQPRKGAIPLARP
jgi:putative tryptophan/tyrosine transport system substrate-binding protein